MTRGDIRVGADGRCRPLIAVWQCSGVGTVPNRFPGRRFSWTHGWLFVIPLAYLISEWVGIHSLRLLRPVSAGTKERSRGDKTFQQLSFEEEGANSRKDY